MNLIHLPVDERASLDGTRKAHVVKTLYKSVQQQIEKGNHMYATKTNKGHKHVVFQPEDWVWMHMHNESFPAQSKSKLHPWGDWIFQLLERINDNAYKVDLPGEYSISVTFNVSDLTMFDIGDDSRSNPFEEREDDAKQPSTKLNHVKDLLEVPSGLITKAKAKKLKQALNEIV